MPVAATAAAAPAPASAESTATGAGDRKRSIRMLDDTTEIDDAMMLNELSIDDGYVESTDAQHVPEYINEIMAYFKVAEVTYLPLMTTYSSSPLS